MVRAPPCHGGGQGFEPLSGRLLNNFQLQLNIWGLSSAGRASALQAEGHRFEPYRPHLNGWIPEWPKGTDCKSAANCFGGSNPPPSISRKALADVAQLAEQLICNQQVIGSSPIIGLISIEIINFISRDGAVWKLVGLITRRSLVQIRPPQLQIING